MLFSFPANADFRSGINGSNVGYGIKFVEYINDSGIAFYINSQIKYEDLKVPGLGEYGIKYYINENGKEFFIDSSWGSYTVDKYKTTDRVDGETIIETFGFTFGVGYAKDLNENTYLTGKIGYRTIKGIKGPYISGGIDFNWPSFGYSSSDDSSDDLGWFSNNKNIFNYAKNNKLIRGKSKKQIENNFGKPDTVFQSGNYTAWSYEKESTKWTGEYTYKKVTLYFINNKLDHWDYYKSD